MKKIDDTGLKITAYLISILFAIMILFPLVYTFGNSLKDDNKIYEIPPRVFPSSAKSVTVVLDYSHLKNIEVGKLLDLLMVDSTLSIYSIPYELNRSNIYEIKVFGIKDGKRIFHTRIHRSQMRLELDYGIYSGAIVKREVLLYENKQKKSAKKFGYVFDINGINDNYDSDKIGKNDLNPAIKELLIEKFNINGKFSGTIVNSNVLLMFESYKYYFTLPSRMYSESEIIKKFSYAIFLMNTLIVLSFAVLAQTFLCAFTAFPLSRMFNKKTANILLLFFLGTMMVPFVSIMIPQFLMFRSMGLYDNYQALLFPYLIPAATFVFLYKVFFDRLPGSFFEAAKIDGASAWYCFTKICLPLSKPVISIVALTTFLDNWNDFFWAWMVTERSELWTLNVALYHLSLDRFVKQNFIMGLSFAAIVPMLLATIIFSKQIKQTIVLSGIKE